jgi:hypothetical protein
MKNGSVNLYELSHNFSDKLLDNYGRHISYILFRLFYLAFILALVSSSANTVSAQHKIDPEAWVEMRKMLFKKGPAPTIEEDIYDLRPYAAVDLEAPGRTAIIRNKIRKAG